MKFNKWTLGLAALGVVSLSSAARADESTNSLLTSVATTTLSGYVDTSINWNLGTGDAHPPAYAYNTPGKQDGFNLDSVKITLNKAEDETDWASGYNVDLFLGPDANFLGTSAIGGIAGTDFALKQAYVSLRTPIGTGIDWKLGLWDTIIGYESTETPNNPNYTRSYGYTIEPTSHTGLQGTYKPIDSISVTGGIANTTGPIIGGETLNPANVAGAGQVSVGRATPVKAESYKTYLASASWTASTNMGWFSGSSLYAGFINGWGGGATIGGVTQNYYVGATLNTPLDKLKVGASYDYFGRSAQTYTATGPLPSQWADDISVYSDFQATEKMSFHSRFDYFWQSTINSPVAAPNKVFAFTETLQYDLWKNVLSRLEFRWDHQAGSLGGTAANAYGGNLTSTSPINGGLNSTAASAGTLRNSWVVMANIIYKF